MAGLKASTTMVVRHGWPEGQHYARPALRSWSARRDGWLKASNTVVVPTFRSASKREAHPKLDMTRRAGGQHLPEGRRPVKVIGQVEVGPVQQIERLRS